MCTVPPRAPTASSSLVVLGTVGRCLERLAWHSRAVPSTSASFAYATRSSRRLRGSTVAPGSGLRRFQERCDRREVPGSLSDDSHDDDVHHDDRHDYVDCELLTRLVLSARGSGDRYALQVLEIPGATRLSSTRCASIAVCHVRELLDGIDLMQGPANLRIGGRGQGPTSEVVTELVSDCLREVVVRPDDRSSQVAAEVREHRDRLPPPTTEGCSAGRRKTSRRPGRAPPRGRSLSRRRRKARSCIFALDGHPDDSDLASDLIEAPDDGWKLTEVGQPCTTVSRCS